MARLKKNGNLSGAIGNIVFVNDGDRAYARSRPGKVRQTKNTKAAASLFGWVSAQEKQFRIILQRMIGLGTIQYFSARHMAVLRKTVADSVKFREPAALVGFDFNQKQQWSRCTNFFPTFMQASDAKLSVGIPALAWGRQIKPPKDADLAKFRLYAVSTDLNQPNVTVEVLSSLELALTPGETLPAREWAIGVPGDTTWLLVIGIISFSSGQKQLDKACQSTGSYLWAKSITG